MWKIYTKFQTLKPFLQITAIFVFMFLHSFMELSCDILYVDGDIPAKRILRIGPRFGQSSQKQRQNFIKRKSRKEVCILFSLNVKI